MSPLRLRHERSHTKVVATLGPASSSKEVLEAGGTKSLSEIITRFYRRVHDKNGTRNGFKPDLIFIIDIESWLLRYESVRCSPTTRMITRNLNYITPPHNRRSSYIILNGGYPWFVGFFPSWL